MEEKNDFLKIDENQSKDSKQKNIIIVLGVAIVFFAIVLTIILISAVASVKNTNDTTRYEMTSTDYTETTTDEDYLNSILEIENSSASIQPGTEGVVQNTLPQSQQPGSIDDVRPEKTTKHEVIEYYEQLSPNGDNKLSDHCDNEFIKLVSEKYNVNSDLLVAIYSEPDSGTNFVLQFNGKKDLTGKYIKSPDTLETVYQIDLERNIKVATGKKEGNEGVSYGESVLCVALVKTIVMEQYPNYFTGLRK